MPNDYIDPWRDEKGNARSVAETTRILDEQRALLLQQTQPQSVQQFSRAPLEVSGIKIQLGEDSVFFGEQNPSGFSEYPETLIGTVQAQLKKILNEMPGRLQEIVRETTPVIPVYNMPKDYDGASAISQFRRQSPKVVKSQIAYGLPQLLGVMLSENSGSGSVDEEAYHELIHALSPAFASESADGPSELVTHRLEHGQYPNHQGFDSIFLRRDSAAIQSTGGFNVPHSSVSRYGSHDALGTLKNAISIDVQSLLGDITIDEAWRVICKVEEHGQNTGCVASLTDAREIIYETCSRSELLLRRPSLQQTNLGTSWAAFPSRSPVRDVAVFGFTTSSLDTKVIQHQSEGSATISLVEISCPNRSHLVEVTPLDNSGNEIFQAAVQFPMTCGYVAMRYQELAPYLLKNNRGSEMLLSVPNLQPIRLSNRKKSNKKNKKKRK